MIYKINDKYYIKVQGHYKECNVSLENDEVLIRATKNSIEAYGIAPIQVSLEEVKAQLKEENKTVREMKTQKKW